MLYKTKGIVFRFTPYSESTIIVTVFTELFGLQSYIVNGVRSKSTRGNKIALFQPLTLLDMVVYHKENANINRIKEYRCFHPYQHLTTDITKSSIAIFINELLNKSVKDQSHAAEIFDFISNALLHLDKAKAGVENFHLIMMIRLSHLLGFGPANVAELLGPRYAVEDEEKLLNGLINSTYENVPRLNAGQRRILLDHLISFYNEHIEGFGEMRSMTILREILS